MNISQFIQENWFAITMLLSWLLFSFLIYLILKLSAKKIISWIQKHLPIDLSGFSSKLSSLLFLFITILSGIFVISIIAREYEIINTATAINNVQSTLGNWLLWILPKLPRIVFILAISIFLLKLNQKFLPILLEKIFYTNKSKGDENEDRRLKTIIVIVTRGIKILIISAASFMILDDLGFSISPMLAGLGIGGIAVALALQPVLSNVFAAAYVVSDGAIHVGDYIELDSGINGFVTEMGWRTTKVKTPFNNMVIIPNSRLSEEIITNYYSPSTEIGIRVTCGVSYESNLTAIEKISLETAKKVIKNCPSAVKDQNPFFAFDNFGDSNIDFWVFLRATDRLGSFQLKSEMIKSLHTRFAKENIEINYPVRRLVFPTESNQISKE